MRGGLAGHIPGKLNQGVLKATARAEEWELGLAGILDAEQGTFETGVGTASGAPDGSGTIEATLHGIRSELVRANPTQLRPRLSRAVKLLDRALKPNMSWLGQVTLADD